MVGFAAGLQDAIVLVTGAGKGIGRGIALALADAGATVDLAERDVAGLEDRRSWSRPT